jgi:hypothetical protein
METGKKMQGRQEKVSALTEEEAGHGRDGARRPPAIERSIEQVTMER